LHNEVNNISSNRRWQTLVKRGLHTIDKAQYQLVYIQPGLMDANERHISKKVISERFDLGPNFFNK
jgi:hypothetical protein